MRTTETVSEPGVQSRVFITEQRVPPLGSGVLDGWEIAVKDNIDVAGLPTTGGTRFLRNHVATTDAEAVARLRRSGACIIGKTNMHELGHGITGINPSYGNTYHPDNPEYTVGGSSGGSALAVSLDHARAALGTDTGGSVRIPASYTGLVGFRPSIGRYPLTGLIRISPSRDTVGILAKTVAHVRTMDGVLSGGFETGHQRPFQSLAVTEESGEGLSPARKKLFEAALAALERRGFNVIRISERRRLDRSFELGITVLAYETIPALREYLGGDCGAEAIYDLIEVSETPDTHEILRDAIEKPVLREEYIAAKQELREMDADFRLALTKLGIDTLIYPTVCCEPPRALGQGGPEDAAQQLRRTVRNSTPATLFGTPAISLPAGLSAETGIPVGVTLEHLGGDDLALLSSAAQVERVLSA